MEEKKKRKMELERKVVENIFRSIHTIRNKAVVIGMCFECGDKFRLNIAKKEIKALIKIAQNDLALVSLTKESNLQFHNILDFLSQKVFEWQEISKMSFEFNSSDLKMNVLFDEHHLSIALADIIKNAIEAHAKKIAIEAQVEGKKAIISIANDGVQIKPDELEKVFEPYFTTKKGGTGLGLSIVKDIIDEHNGSIAVSSNDKGTKFTISLPLCNE